MKAHPGMKPQDILVLFKVICLKDSKWRYSDLAHALEMSQSEVFESLERSRIAGLVDGEKRKVFRGALVEFLSYGLKYAFPAEPGPLCRGMPTAHSAAPLADRIVGSETDSYVWPTEDGTSRGQAIRPLYSSVPLAAKKDPELYEYLALSDALRVGRAREKQIAQDELKKKLNEQK